MRGVFPGYVISSPPLFFLFLNFKSQAPSCPRPPSPAGGVGGGPAGGAAGRGRGPSLPRPGAPAVPRGGRRESGCRSGVSGGGGSGGPSPAATCASSAGPGGSGAAGPVAEARRALLAGPRALGVAWREPRGAAAPAALAGRFPEVVPEWTWRMTSCPCCLPTGTWRTRRWWDEGLGQTPQAPLEEGAALSKLTGHRSFSSMDGGTLVGSRLQRVLRT